MIRVTHRPLLAVLGASAVLVGTAAPSVALTDGHSLTSPPGLSGEIGTITTVPHSTEAMAIANTGNLKPDNGFFGLERKGGVWRKIAAPVLGGRVGETAGAITSLAAGSAGTIWAAGSYASSDSSETPAIWRWTSAGWVMQSLPDLASASTTEIDSISASSPTNAWAGGDIATSTGQAVSLHWNGTTWSEAPLPLKDIGGRLSSVSTSGPANTWGLAGYGSLSQNVIVHWVKGQWTVAKRIPDGIEVDKVATSSSHLTYAIGTVFVNSGLRNSFVWKYNGTTWSKMALPATDRHLAYMSVAVHGRSIWIVARDPGSLADRIIHSTGGRWSTELQLPPVHQFTPVYGFTLDEISAETSTQALAGGESAKGRTYVIQSKGSKWTAEDSK